MPTGRMMRITCRLAGTPRSVSATATFDRKKS
jgi:hypothetical protein